MATNQEIEVLMSNRNNLQSVENMINRQMINRLKEKRAKLKSIAHIKNIHYGQDIYVVGSGPSLNFINKRFFDNKIVVGINEVYKLVQCTYVVKMHKLFAQEAIDEKQTLVISKLDCGLGDINILNGIYFVYNHSLNKNSKKIDLSVIDSFDSLAIGKSTILPAIHFAYYLGARNIILAGHDCGTIDENVNYNGYHKGKEVDTQDNLKQIMRNIEPQTLQLVNEIRQKGITVCSINPFINLGLEGHIYEGGN